MCCREGGGGRRSLAGEAAEVGRGAADGPAHLGEVKEVAVVTRSVHLAHAGVRMAGGHPC